MFFMKILLLSPEFHEKTLNGSGDIKIFCPGRRTYMYTLPPFMDVVLSVERQLMKCMGIFQVEILWVGIFRVEFFMGEIFLCGNFPGGSFPGRRIFPEPKKVFTQIFG